VSPADGLYQATDKWGAAQLPLSEGAIFHRYPGKDEAPRRRGLLRQAEGRGRPGYDDWALEGTRFVRNGEATEELPRFVLVPRSPLVAYSGVSDDLARLLADRYVAAEFSLQRGAPPALRSAGRRSICLSRAGRVERPGLNFSSTRSGSAPPGRADRSLGAGIH
jgi:hypothetical protein